MFYEQILKYLEYRENGVKRSGAGFVKLEIRGECVHLVVQVKLCDLPSLRMNTAEYQVTLQGRDESKELCMMRLEKGQGRLELRNMSAQNFAGCGLPASSIEEVRIDLGPGRELVCRLRENAEDIGYMTDAGGVSEKAEMAGRTPLNGAERDKIERTPVDDTESVNAEMAGRTPVDGPKGAKTEKEERQASSDGCPFIPAVDFREGSAKDVEDWDQRNAGCKIQNGIGSCNPSTIDGFKNIEMTEKAAAKGSVEKSGDTEAPTEKKMPQPYSFQKSLKSGKWEQLQAVYPHVTPFGDNRTYLQISPADFVILKDRSYKLANNSFLLHGYFSYKHLILHRIRRKNENLYYVGVPGNFYDKEKEVALLFGFESFECANEPAREGDYGYYMMRVEL